MLAEVVSMHSNLAPGVLKFCRFGRDTVWA